MGGFFSTVQQKASNAVTAVSGAASNAATAVSGAASRARNAVTGKPPLPNESNKKEGNTPVEQVVGQVGEEVVGDVVKVAEEIPAAAVVGGSRRKSKKFKKSKKSKKSKKTKRNPRH